MLNYSYKYWEKPKDVKKWIKFLSVGVIQIHHFTLKLNRKVGVYIIDFVRCICRNAVKISSAITCRNKEDDYLLN